MQINQRSPEAQAYHRWYGLKLWAHKPTGLRWQCLVAALFACEDCGWQARANETHLLHCDHVIPHRRDWVLFTDPMNLRCLCHTCHNAAKQSEERLGYSKAIGEDGWPLDINHPSNGGKRDTSRDGLGPMSHPVWFRPLYVPLTIVCGPPASGKSTYVQHHAKDSDAVFDLDNIAMETFGFPVRYIDTKQRMDCLRVRNDRMGKLMRASGREIANAAWLIVAEPKAERRQWWVNQLKPKQIIVLAVSRDECIARAIKDEATRKWRGQEAAASIKQWWADYRPRQGDIVVQ